MKLNFSILVIVFLTVGCSTAPKSFFWEIEKQGRISHVFGTIHQGVPYQDVPEGIKQYFLLANTAALEVTHELEVNEAQFLENFKADQRRRLKENRQKNRRLTPHFSREEWQQIVKKTAKKKVDPSDLEFFTPEMVSLLINQSEPIVLTAQESALLRTPMMDQNIYNKALELKKTVLRLDRNPPIPTVCWDDIFISGIKKRLRYGAKKPIEDYLALIELYRNGDEEKLYEGLQASGQLKDCLFRDRNQHWSQVINQVHNTQSPLFIAAGVGHFIGEFNVLDLLKQKGFTVRRHSGRELLQ